MKTALAYSYLRFSSAAQEEGDTVRRQTDLRNAWLKRHPDVKLDTSLVLEDRGVPAYRGQNRKTGDLAVFLDLIKRGRIPEGSFFVVESLDRLSRETPWESVPLLCSIVNAGITVVTLEPREVEYTKDDDLTPLILAVVE